MQQNKRKRDPVELCFHPFINISPIFTLLKGTKIKQADHITLYHKTILT